MKIDKLRLFVIVSAAFVFLDQLTKYLAAKSEVSIVLIKNFLSLIYTTNTGAGFSILQGRQIFLILFSIIALGIIIYYYRQTPARWIPFTAMVFGGAMGNLIDRVIRGHVIDFISFSFWPSFNVADIGVMLGVIGLVWMIWRS
ncbi:signal peptidase II [Candidatus Woesearchaeota archaeon CG10_big_fil_rev_8_21_14_0_10_44_13]|nr:MAG: signal peptidase II [Candidatus Woesearchaeota archaeon CG10_big_fil_rev_8_21_14_0_10_44_13]